MLKVVRKAIATYRIKKVLAKPRNNRRTVSLKEAGSIAIVYSSDSEKTYDMISRFAAKLEKSGKKVVLLAYAPVKVIPAYYVPSMFHEFFTQKDINWFYIPVGKKLAFFLDREYDIFINLSLNKSMPILYIATMVRAGMKVSNYSDYNEPVHDLMINTGNDTTVAELIQQIEHYLGMINSRPEQ